MSRKSNVNIEIWIGSASKSPDLRHKRIYLDIVVRVSFGVEVLEGVDDLYGEGAGQRGGQRMTTILENFIQINSQPERRTRTIYSDANCCS
jgi:hypothetical protein